MEEGVVSLLYFVTCQLTRLIMMHVSSGLIPRVNTAYFSLHRSDAISNCSTSRLQRLNKLYNGLKMLDLSLLTCFCTDYTT